MTPKEFKQLSTIEKLKIMFGEQVANLCQTIVMAEGNPFSRSDFLQIKHSVGWLHRCMMRSHWNIPEVGNGEFTPFYRFDIEGVDVIQFDQDCDRFYSMCYRLTEGNPVFPPIQLDNTLKSFTCPGF